MRRMRQRVYAEQVFSEPKVLLRLLQKTLLEKYKKFGQDKKILLTCYHCGRLFYADRKTVKYCSRLCYLNGITRHE